MLDPESSIRFRTLVAGKRVALVGPSRSLIGSCGGEVIDRFDLVVRVNHQWPIPPERVTDLGSRMDLLYHCCNGDYPVGELFNETFQQTKFVCYEEGPERAALVSYCQQAGIDTMDVTKWYRHLFAGLRSYPNTGFVAITHLLSEPLSELFITGFSFFREPYYEGYRGAANQISLWSGGTYPKKLWRHDPDAQLGYFRKIASDKRIILDETLKKIVVDE